ncbi:hypothetical protein COLU111180_17055 [Cohnella lubricantis]|uniref:Type II secretion system protein GspF domain-containing protein n=1 Tax=Cohnella lubricantis TaxID=2163172 RepID=A0A841TG86_9BACL|nr:hypothetical protein [Cohnella lubricantis]MBB6677957.1 hypothetical protein [Cohnella lubricantis]MBP2119975.1 hypothetical protein [Cohnella lubricantis]
MAQYDTGLYYTLGFAVQFVLAAIGIGLLLRHLSARRPRWRIARRALHRRQPPLWLLRLTGSHRDSQPLRERSALLAGCGLRWPAEWYLALRRTALALLPLAAIAAYAIEEAGALSGLQAGYAETAMLGAAILVYFDRFGLEAVKRYRADRIRREIVLISNQLLYYAGSRLHLHGKLMRCLPYTRLMKWELQLMLNEWYYDPEGAISRFKERLGTSEAYGFAETIRSLRLNESGEVFDMLRESVKEYKAKIELAKAGRKETVSYALFVLAGLPILYTFQVFLYPWVQQSRQLFDVLNS